MAWFSVVCFNIYILSNINLLFVLLRFLARKIHWLLIDILGIVKAWPGIILRLLLRTILWQFIRLVKNGLRDIGNI